eukprot:gene12040-biopygen10960
MRAIRSESHRKTTRRRRREFLLLHHFSAAALAWAVPGTALALWVPQAPWDERSGQQVPLRGNGDSPFLKGGTQRGKFPLERGRCRPGGEGDHCDHNIWQWYATVRTHRPFFWHHRSHPPRLRPPIPEAGAGCLRILVCGPVAAAGAAGRGGGFVPPRAGGVQAQPWRSAP